MGLIIAAGDTRPVFPYDYYYGVKINVNVADTKLERVGRPELHSSLPVQSLMRRCLLDDTGHVVAYLHPTDSTKTDTGQAADLTGAKGMVMVEIPKHYRKFEFDGATFTALISQIPLPGFTEVPKLYRSAYEATIDRTKKDLPKLASLASNSKVFRGGNNNAEWDGTYRSLLGRPATNVAFQDLFRFARNRGFADRPNKGWYPDLYEAQKTTYWLYVIEYANLNCQLGFNAQPTKEGYKQGGLGAGVTTLDSNKWNYFNSFKPFVPCGTTNPLGNASGVVEYTMPKEYDTEAVIKVGVPSYRGIENPFGHIAKFAAGWKFVVRNISGNKSAKLYSASIDDETPRVLNEGADIYKGELPRYEGFIKRIMMGENGDILPAEISGSSSTFFADKYCVRFLNGEGVKAAAFGGNAASGEEAGFCNLDIYFGFHEELNVGTRLCFLPPSFPER